MTVTVKFWSYFKDHTECAETSIELPAGATLGEAHAAVIAQFPVLGDMQNSTLKAVGVNYQPDDFLISDGDEISLFPPVQGG